MIIPTSGLLTVQNMADRSSSDSSALEGTVANIDAPAPLHWCDNLAAIARNLGRNLIISIQYPVMTA